MPRVKIKDLPRDRELSKDDLKKVFGGVPNGAPLATFGPDGSFIDPNAMGPPMQGIPNVAPVG